MQDAPRKIKLSEVMLGWKGQVCIFAFAAVYAFSASWTSTLLVIVILEVMIPLVRYRQVVSPIPTDPNWPQVVTHDDVMKLHLLAYQQVLACSDLDSETSSMIGRRVVDNVLKELEHKGRIQIVRNIPYK
jgi:hypothetical protein